MMDPCSLAEKRRKVMSKFEFVKRSELTKVFESDVTFLEGIMNYLEEKKVSEESLGEEKKVSEESVEEEKENCEYKIKRMPREFSRAQHNQTRLSEGLWTVELKYFQSKISCFLDHIPEDKSVWGLVVGTQPERVVLLDVEGRAWPVAPGDTLGDVLKRKMCILEFPTFVIY